MENDEANNLRLWNKFACFLKVEPVRRAVSKSQSNNTQSPVSNTPTKIISEVPTCSCELTQYQTTLVCFNATDDIKFRLRNLERMSNWTDALHDPYCLIDILLDELYHLVMIHIKSLRHEFRHIENVRHICTKRNSIIYMKLTLQIVNHSVSIHTKTCFGARQLLCFTQHDKGHTILGRES
jgi:hypothetical protein